MEEIYHMEYERLHEVRDKASPRAHPDIPITTNFMQLYDGLDYRPMAKELDVISWDSYLDSTTTMSLADVMGQNTFDHAVMRSMKRISLSCLWRVLRACKLASI